MELFKNDKLFKEAIGAFIIASSEMEFAVANLCSIICEDPRLHQKQLFDTMGLPLDKKRTILSEFIKNNIPSLAMEWININDSIGRINADRRYLAHGFTQYFLPGEYIETYIKNKGQITKKRFSISDIAALTNKIHHINTGINGINGVFNTKLFVARINLWNELVDVQKKMIYKVNDQILTDWKGSDQLSLD
jgi:hypothetical protein